MRIPSFDGTNRALLSLSKETVSQHSSLKRTTIFTRQIVKGQEKKVSRRNVMVSKFVRHHGQVFQCGMLYISLPSTKFEMPRVRAD